MKVCPHCAEHIQDAAIVCKHCGRRLQPSQTPVAIIAVALLILVGVLAFVSHEMTDTTRAQMGARRVVEAPESSRLAPQLEFSRGYFQRRLIEDGADLSSRFGADLAMLGLKGRAMQALPLDEAYVSVADAVNRVEDPAMRRRMKLELLDLTEN